VGGKAKNQPGDKKRRRLRFAKTTISKTRTRKENGLGDELARQRKKGERSRWGLKKGGIKKEKGVSGRGESSQGLLGSSELLNQKSCKILRGTREKPRKVVAGKEGGSKTQEKRVGRKRAKGKLRQENGKPVFLKAVNWSQKPVCLQPNNKNEKGKRWKRG